MGIAGPATNESLNDIHTEIEEAFTPTQRMLRKIQEARGTQSDEAILRAYTETFPEAAPAVEPFLQKYGASTALDEIIDHYMGIGGARMGEKLELRHEPPSTGELVTPEALEKRQIQSRLAGQGYSAEEIERIVPVIRGQEVPAPPAIEPPREIRKIIGVPPAKEQADYNVLGGIATFVKGLPLLGKQVGVNLLIALQGHRGASVADRGFADRAWAAVQEDQEKFVRETARLYKDQDFFPGISVEDISQLPQSLAYSTAVGLGGLGAGAPIAAIPVPGMRGVAFAVGGAVATGVAFNLASYEVMQEYLEVKNEEMRKAKGRDITVAEEKQLKKDFSSDATKYGLWEALPEVAAGALTVSVLLKPLGRIAGRSIATQIVGKLGMIYGGELATETGTQLGQLPIRKAAGLPGGRDVDWTSPTDWIKALKEVAPQTLLVTSVMAGVGAAAVKARSYRQMTKQQRIDEAVETLASEIGRDDPDFHNFLEKIEQIEPSTELGIEPVPYELPEGVVPAGRTAEEMPIAIKELPAQEQAATPVNVEDPPAPVPVESQDSSDKQAVAETLEAGGFVPPDVLKQYPDLVDKYGAAMSEKYDVDIAKEEAAVEEAEQPPLPPTAEAKAIIEGVDAAVLEQLVSQRELPADERISDEDALDAIRQLGPEAESAIDRALAEHSPDVLLDELAGQSQKRTSEQSDLDALMKQNAQEMRSRMTVEEQKGIFVQPKKGAEPEITDPNLRAALYAGRKSTNRFKFYGQYMRDIGADIKEFAAAEFEPELKKAMPQFWDDYRTGALPIGMRAREQSEMGLGGIWGNLKKEQRDTVLNIIGMEDFVETGGEGIELPRGLTLDVVAADLDRVRQQASPEVLEAVEKYQEFMQVVAQDLVARGKLPEEAVRSFYFPHMVMDYMPEWWTASPLRPRRVRKPFRSYTKKRAGSSRDIAVSEEALHVHLSTVFADNMMDDWAQGQLESYDLWEKLTPEQRQDVFGRRPNGRQKTPVPNKMYEYKDERYFGFQYLPGNVIYQAEAVNFKVLQQAVEDALEEAALVGEQADSAREALERVRAMDEYTDLRDYLENVAPRGLMEADKVRNAFRKVRAIGQYHKTHVIPEAMYKKMRRFKEPAGYIPLLYDVIGFMGFWKRLTLSPIGAGIPFQLGNLYGDMQNLYRTSAGATKELPGSVKILNNLRTPDKLSEFDRKVLSVALNKDVFGSGFVREYSTVQPMLSAKGWWRKYERLSALREASTRVAMLRYQMRRVEKGIPLNAPEFEKTTKNLDPESGAAFIARNFTVDYLAVPDYYRRYVRGLAFPFATFWQKNAQNWAAYTIHAPGPMVAKFIGPVAGIWLYNNTFKRDIEEKLGFMRRRMFHINIRKFDMDGDGLDDHGLVWAPQTPLDMAAEFIGANLIGDKITMVRRKMLTPKEAAVQQLTDMGLATPRLLRRLTAPMIQIIDGLVTNRDPFTRQEIVPKELMGLPEHDKLRYWTPFILEHLITPFGQYMSGADRTDSTIINLLGAEVPPWLEPIAKGPADVPRGLGFYLVDLNKAERQREMALGRRARGVWASSMHSLEAAYINSGMLPPEFLATKAAQSIIKNAGQQDIAISRAQAMERLGGLRVQIGRWQEKLRKAKTKAARQEAQRQLDALLTRRKAEYLGKIPKAAQPRLRKSLTEGGK